MNYLKIDPSIHFVFGRGTRQLPIEVVDAHMQPIKDYDLMCMALLEDIRNPHGSGATALEEIRRIESGEKDYIEADGNAWVCYINREKVWFEGLYSQGEGGEVSFAQYKFAVQTYVEFLRGPQDKALEVPFPTD